MNSLELQEKILNLRKELTEIVNQAETRSLEENENSRLAELRTEIDNAEAELKSIEKENQKIENNKEKKQTRKMENRTSLYSLIKGVALGNLSDEQRAFVNGNNIDYRAAIQAQSTTHGEETIAEIKEPLEVAIRNNTVLNKIGCTWFSGIKGDISIPRYSGSNVKWASEVAAAEDGAGTFSEIILKPRRLTAYVDISKTLLAQDSVDVESNVMDDLAKAVAEKLDLTVFGNASGTTEIPEGLFYNSGYTTTGETSLSAVTYDNVLKLEQGVELKNGQNFIFIAHPKVKYAFKGTDRAAGFGKMVWEGNELDGYPVIVSNSVVNKGLMCVDPKDIAVGVWNGITVQVDTVTRAIYNEVRLVVNFYVDMKLRENKRIACEIFD